MTLWGIIKTITMRCVFCKNDSSNSKSIEHIVPESLGNKSHTLPLGIVCDDCNKYFSIKIEKIILEMPFFKDLRHRNSIESKKGNIPSGIAIIPETSSIGEIIKEKDKIPIINLDTNSFNAIVNGKVNRFLIPFLTEPEKANRIFSRFLCKIALEVMAQRLLEFSEGLNYLIDEKQLDPIRNYVRYDKSKEIWQYNFRKIYSEDEMFYDKSDKPTDMVFEYDIFVTEHSEYYFVIIIKGYEFVINIGGETIEGYLDWLSKNENKSPLYVKQYDYPFPRLKKNNAP